MPKAKKPPERVKVLEYAVPQEIIERQLEGWMRGVLESKDELAAALERLRDSYCALLAGKKPVKDDDEILAQVEAALTQAEKAKNVV
jgi:hypothetical protein